MDLNDPENICPLCYGIPMDGRVHKGPHNKKIDEASLKTYHGLVWLELLKVFRGGINDSLKKVKKCPLKALLEDLCARLHDPEDALRRLVTENNRDNG